MMEDRIGSLRPGKQADLVMLRADDLNIFPVNDPVNSVVLFATPANVDTVMIAGRKVKEGGRLAFPADSRARLQRRLADSAARLFAEAGYVHQAV